MEKISTRVISLLKIILKDHVQKKSVQFGCSNLAMDELCFRPEYTFKAVLFHSESDG